MNQYVALYRSKKITVEAETSYAAQQKAAVIFKTKKRHEVTIVLAGVNGEPVVHKPQDVVG